MSIGYACLTVGVPNTSFKTCRLKNASEEKLIEIISQNFSSLENIIDYNIKHKIKLFRISSDLIPFGSSDANTLNWWELFGTKLLSCEEKIKYSAMRVSMHPGQYTILNSPNKVVVERSIKDLYYHNRVLDSLNTTESSKIILHIGGVYGDKKQSINRFIENYKFLDDLIKKRLVIENDDKSYNIEDVLEIGHRLNIPVVFDNLHNEINPSFSDKSEYYFINQCKSTWQTKDGKQKIHYSQQDPLKKKGAHASTIDIDKFQNFYNGLKDKDIDIMLEVKDKNLSALKCMNSIKSNLLDLR